MRKIVIVYFSGTGNTKIVADEIVKHLKAETYDAELIPVENAEAIKGIDLSNKVLGIGFPVYAGSYQHELFDKAIEYLGNQSEPVPAFVFCTYAGMAMGMGIMARRLKDDNIYTLIQKGFKCPSSGWGTFMSEKNLGYNIMNSFDKNLFAKIKKYVRKLIERLEKFEDKPFLKLGFVLPMTHTFVKLNEESEKKNLFYNLTIDKEKCTDCGLCAEKCPIGNIVSNNNQIEIADKDNCLLCGRCISICPVGAVFWGSHERHRRYTKEYRDELLKKVKVPNITRNNASGLEEMEKKQVN